MSWHGSGDLAFLKEDGTEGSQDDKDVTPVIKMTLTHGRSREVYQDFEARDKPAHLKFEVSVYASSDFKRSAFKNDYTDEAYIKNHTEFFWWYVIVPEADFWIRGGTGGNSSFMYTEQKLTPGAWTTVKSEWDTYDQLEERSVNFCTPPGEGTIYLKNPSVKP